MAQNPDEKQTGQFADEFGKHIATEMMGIVGMIKANQQSIRAVEEKLSRLENAKLEALDTRALEERLTRLFDEKAGKGSIRALDEKLARIEERLSKNENAASKVSMSIEELKNVPSDVLSKVASFETTVSKQDDLNRAVLAVIDDFRVRMEDYPTRSEIDPILREAETVMLDDLNRQRNDLNALLATLAEDYKDGTISEKTFNETKTRTEEKLSVIDDKMKRFVEAFADRADAKTERPEPPITEKEKLADAKLADIRKREGRIDLLEKKIESSSQQMAPLAQSLTSNSDKVTGLEKKLDELAKLAVSSDEARAARIGELEKKLDDFTKQAEASSAKRISGLEKKLDDSAKLAGGKLSELEKKITELPKGVEPDRLFMVEKRLGELAGRLEGIGRTVSSGENRMKDIDGRLKEKESKRILPTASALSSDAQRPARPAPRGGLLGKILGAEKTESGEVTPIMDIPVMAEKMKMPEKIVVELDAPLAAAITPPQYHGPRKKREEHLKAELESLEGVLAKLKGAKTGTLSAVREPMPRDDLFLKLRNQKAELEGLLRMVEKRHADGAIENAGYEEIRTRTLDRLSKISEMLEQRK